MRARQLCADQKAAGLRGPRYGSRIRDSWRTALRLAVSGRSLNLSSRAGSGHIFGAFDGSQSSNPQVIGRGPNPGAVVIGLIWSDRNENLALTCGANIAGGFVGRVNDRNVLTREQLGNLRNIGGFVEHNVE